MKMLLTPQYETLALFEGVWVGEEHVAPSPWIPADAARGKSAYRHDIKDTIMTPL